MVDWIEPLALQTWLQNVFAGTPEIFITIALLVIATMAGYFRMTSAGLFFMLALFLIMMSSFISSPLIVLMIVIAGLLIGYTMSRVFGQ